MMKLFRLRRRCVYRVTQSDRQPSTHERLVVACADLGRGFQVWRRNVSLMDGLHGAHLTSNGRCLVTWDSCTRSNLKALIKIPFFKVILCLGKAGR